MPARSYTWLSGESALLGAVQIAGISAGASADTGTLTLAFATIPLAGTSAGGSADTGALDAVAAKHIVVRIRSSTGWLDLSPIVGYYSTNTHAAGTTISILQNTHKLRPTRGLMVTIHNETTGAQEVVADVTVSTDGNVTVTFGASVAANSKRVTIMGPVA